MTNQIELRNINKYYGAFHALKNLSVDIEKGSFVALVGPSGCGKSTLLRSIAGLETVTSGTIMIAGEQMQGVPPRKRDIAMVFQSYALYPHMTVEQNLTYSLRWKKVPKAEARQRAMEVAATTGLTDLMERFPRQLSGGQRQRVAMGRAIIRDPKAFLFDEPLSNLDAALRVQMRKEVRASHDRLGATSVYVTHDQIEAMTMADKVVVMHDGIIEQQGAPLELFDTPVNKFVAGFIGSPAMNFIDAVGSDNGHTVILEGLGGQKIAVNTKVDPGRKLTVGLRPEHLHIASQGEGIEVRIAMTESTGSITYLTGEDGIFTVVLHGRSDVHDGDTINLKIDPALVHVFDAVTGMRV